MSSKKRINLWLSESKAGNTYLSGKDRDTGDRFYVFSNKNGGGKTVKIKRNGSTEFSDTIELTQRQNDEDVYFVSSGVLLAENSFYVSDEDPEAAINGDIRYLTNKEGELILNSKGDPIEKPSHQLVMDVS